MSTINYTYNVIVDRFRQFSDGHFQLRRFTHGEISQADLEKEAEWPWMHVKPRAINYSPGTRAFSFEIFISDLPRDKEDKTGYQAESITDCSLIFQDLINEIHLGNMFGDDVLLTRPVNSEPFVEQYTHTLTGVTGIIELSLDYDWSACSIPASWNYNTPTDSPSDGWGALQFIESLDQNGVFVSLLNDLEAPGNSYYYGTDGSGVKGWYEIVDNIGLTCKDLPDCAVIIGILDDIIALQTDVALKANTADLGATAFSNDYNDLDHLPALPTGTVTSVGLTAGQGISVSGGPITSSGSITVTNSLPDQVVALTAGTGIGVTGTYPNFTVTNSAPSSGGTVTSVTATLPISSTGGATPNLSISAANGTTNGYLLSSDWLIFNGKFNTPSGTTLQYLRGDGSLATFPTITSGTVTSVAALTLGTTGTDLSSTVATGTTTPVITLNVPTASAANRGALSAADWATFNGKQAAITGAATTITTADLTASSVLVSDASGKVAANAVTTTTLGFLDATSSIQTQLNAKGYAMGGNLNQTTIAVSTTYMGIGIATTNTTETTRRISVLAGTVSRLFLRTTANMTGSMAITLMKNGTATAMTFTIAATSAIALYSTTSNTFTVVDGDELSIRIVQSTATSSGVSSFGFHIK